MTFVSVILSIIVIGALIAYQRGGKSTSEHSFDDNNNNGPQPPLDLEFVQRHWAEIQQMSGAGAAGLKNSLIEADKLLDYVMIGKGFKGQNLGDRLKLNGSKFSDLNGIWTAHKLRNQLAHEVNIDIVPNQIKDAVTKLGQGIRDLGVKL